MAIKRLSWKRVGNEKHAQISEGMYYVIVTLSRDKYRLARVSHDGGEWQYHVIGWYPNIESAKKVARVVYRAQFTG